MRPPLNRKLDYSDYAAIPEDGKRYEVLEGSLYVMTAPNTAHQHASKRLQRQLEAYFEPRGLEVFNAPLDVILGAHDIVQPDLVVVRPEQVSKRGIEGAPLIAVAILSPSTREHDRERKRRRYAELGVGQLWFVDSDARRLECYRLESGWYALVVSGDDARSVAHPDFPDLTIEPLWR